MGKIFFCGDPHGHYNHIIKPVKEYRPAAVILLGDQQAERSLEIELGEIISKTEIWFIPGNHDTDSESDYDNLFSSKLSDRNLHARVVEIAGIRIAGLGGVFRSKVWMPPDNPEFESPAEYLKRCGKGNHWRGGLPLKHRSTIFPSEYFGLIGQRADVLITHDAPGVHPYGSDLISDLARNLGIGNQRLLKSFHGHQHDSLRYPAQDGFQPYGVGLRGITSLDTETWEIEIIRPGEQDSQRQQHREKMVFK